MRALRAATLLFAALPIGCGVKAPPVAPGDVVPERPRSFGIESVAGAIELTWRAPERYDDDAPLTDLGGFHVIREVGTGRADRKVVDVPAIPKARPDDDPRYRRRDTDLLPGETYRYWVRAYGADGYDGAPAGPLRFVWEAPPLPPDVTATPGDRHVVLEWFVSEDADVAFHVYRLTDDGPRRITAEPIRRSAYTATGLVNGEPVRFEVRSVIRADRAGGRHPIEGPGSAPVEVVPVDTIAPAPPTDVLAVHVVAGILVRWTPGPVDDDVVGHHVYARERGGEWVRLTAEPTSGPDYLDERPPPRTERAYRVTAVDTSGQESAFSEPATVGFR